MIHSAIIRGEEGIIREGPSLSFARREQRALAGPG